MGEKTYVQFQAEKEHKEKWQEYAESNAEYGSFSHFLRLAVRRELQRNNDGVAEVATDDVNVGLDTEAKEAITQTRGATDEILQKFREMSDTVSRIEKRQDTITDPTDACVGVLPMAKPYTEEWSRQRSAVHERNPDIVWSGKIGDIADALGREVDDVQMRLGASQMKEHSPVVAEEIEGEIRYWKAG